MKKFSAVVAALSACLFASYASAQKTPVAVQAEINSKIVPNGVGAITGPVLNGVLTDMMGTVNYSAAGLQATSVVGVDSTGISDSTVGLQAAATAAAGNILYIPKGTYKTSSPIYLPSHSHVVCSPGATFAPVTGFSVLATPNYNRNILTDLTPTTPANQTDLNSQVEGCTFDFTGVTVTSGGPPGDGATGFSAYLAKRVRFVTNHVIGGSTQASAPEMARCIASDNCEFADNGGSNVGAGIDAWQGATNILIYHNWVSLVSNPSAWGNIYCFGINGVGTNAANNEITTGFEVGDNLCYTNGNSAAMQFDALGPTSQVKNGSIHDNLFVAASGTGNNGLYGRGQVGGISITGNKFVGQNINPVLIGPFYASGGPFTCTNCISTTNGSSSVVIAISSLNLTNAGVGDYLALTTSNTIGGLTLIGAGAYYPIIAATPGVSVTINAGSNATSTVANGGGSFGTNVYWGNSANMTVAGNTLVNASNPSAPLISVSGAGNVAANNSATGGTYGSVAYADSIVAGALASPYPLLYGNVGAAGSGVSGSVGDNVNNYNSANIPTLPMIGQADGTTICNSSGALAVPTAMASCVLKGTTGPSTTYTNTTNTRSLQIGVNDNFNGVIDAQSGAALLFKISGTTSLNVNAPGTASTSTTTGAAVVTGGLGVSGAGYFGSAVLGTPLAGASGGTNCSTASGTCLDNITGFASTGLISRTGSGAYSFTSPGSNVLSALATATETTGGFGRINGAMTAGDCVKWSASGFQDAGAACGTGGSGITALTGDVAASGTGSVTATLATVNSNTGSWGSATAVATFSVNGKGLITAAGNTTITPAATSIAAGALGSTVTVNNANWSGAGLALTNLATQATYTFLANNTAGTATPTAVTSNSAVFTAMGNTVNAANGLLTYAIIGTSGATVPLLNSAPTASGAWTFTSAAPQITFGANGGNVGELKINGNTSGSALITVQAAAGTPTITLGTASGTPAVTASGPLAIATATGNITCATCVTSSGGGAMTGTSPISVSAAGAISISGAAGQIPNGATGAFTATPTLGASGTLGTLTMGNATSGLLTLAPVTGALGTVTASFPANTGTVAELNLAQTWTATQTLPSPVFTGTVSGAGTVPLTVLATQADGTMLCNTSGSSSSPTASNTCQLKATIGPYITFNNTANARTLQIGLNDNFNSVLDYEGGSGLFFKSAGAVTAVTFGASGTAATSITTGTVVVTGGFSASGAIYGASFAAGSTAGVTCSGTPTASFAATGGIVTHC